MSGSKFNLRVCEGQASPKLQLGSVKLGCWASGYTKSFWSEVQSWVSLEEIIAIKGGKSV